LLGYSASLNVKETVSACSGRSGRETVRSGHDGLAWPYFRQPV